MVFLKFSSLIDTVDEMIMSEAQK